MTMNARLNTVARSQCSGTQRVLRSRLCSSAPARPARRQTHLLVLASGAGAFHPALHPNVQPGVRPSGPALSSSQPPAIAPSATLYAKLGGDAAVQAAVNLFYTKVPNDPQLSRFFEGVDMKKLERHQLEFMTMAFGGPNNYRGRSIALAHKRLIEEMGLSNRHFDLVAGHLVACLKELGIAQPLIDEVVTRVVPLRDDFPEPKA